MYKCKNTVVVVIFNRLDYTKELFKQIKKVEPEKLYIISDGARKSVENEALKVKKCREVFDKINWTCDVEKIYASENLGCKKRIITGLDHVFLKESQAIILEDDCIPTEAFFEFCDWGLKKYKDFKEIGIISGSNLLDYQTKYEILYKAGFSKYINCWGWATWRHTWNKFDSFLSIKEINCSKDDLFKDTSLTKFQKEYWIEIFKHSVVSNSIWDFYLQYSFFKNNLLSVYPRYNLIENIGFSEDSTHTAKKMDFVEKSVPTIEKLREVINSKEPETIVKNKLRDQEIIKTLYGFSIISMFKIKLGNIIRFLGIRK